MVFDLISFSSSSNPGTVKKPYLSTCYLFAIDLIIAWE